MNSCVLAIKEISCIYSYALNLIAKSVQRAKDISIPPTIRVKTRHPATGEVKTKLLAQGSSEGCLSLAGRNNSLSWHLAKTLLPKHPTILVNKSCRITCDFV